MRTHRALDQNSGTADSMLNMNFVSSPSLDANQTKQPRNFITYMLKCRPASLRGADQIEANMTEKTIDPRSGSRNSASEATGIQRLLAEVRSQREFH